MKSALLIFLGSGAGGCLRYGISRLLQYQVTSSGFPWATLVSNILACLLAGYLSGRYLPESKLTEAGALLLITGFCGGFSTFSAFSLETIQLIRAGLWFPAAAFVLLSLATSLSAVWIFQRSA